METPDPSDSGPQPPDEVRAWSAEREAARAERDWATADERKSRIEAAGWRVVDGPTGTELRPAIAADVVDAEGRIRYGDPRSVPSRDDEPAGAPASVIVLEPGADLAASAALLPEGCELIAFVAPDEPAPAAATEIIASVRPFTPGEALEACCRRAVGEIIVVLGDGRGPLADPVGPIADALADPRVAVAGVEALATSDLRRFGRADGIDATTVGPGCYGFRRSDALAVRPIDAGLLDPLGLSAWVGLSLRDAGADHEPRVARIVPGLVPAIDPDELAGRPSREQRRDGYRIERRFRGRDDLAVQRDRTASGRR